MRRSVPSFPTVVALLACVATTCLLDAACSRSDANGGADGGPKACSTPDCRLDPDERCLPCFENLGRCCYDDATIDGRAKALAASCEKRDDCRRCCSECAARGCEVIKAANDCPNLGR